LDKERDVPGAA